MAFVQGDCVITTDHSHQMNSPLELLRALPNNDILDVSNNRKRTHLCKFIFDLQARDFHSLLGQYLDGVQ